MFCRKIFSTLLTYLHHIEYRYDDAVREVKDTEKALEEERKDTRKRLHIHQEVTFFGKIRSFFF